MLKLYYFLKSQSLNAFLDKLFNPLFLIALGKGTL